MKINSSSRQNSGNVLLVTLAITGILGFALASYLTLIAAQNRSVARSQTWNSSIPISEAGVEEAIVHLNRNCLWNPITGAPVDWEADEWTAVTGGIQKTRYLGENYYVVTITTNAPYSTNDPGIFSKGYVPTSLVKNSSSSLLAAIGVAADDAPQQYVGRQVRVKTGKDGFMTRAMVAKDSIDLMGNKIQTDSFDSGNPAYSSNGLYVATMNRANGDVAVNNGLEDSLNLGNAEIYGSIAVGPGGEIEIGPNGKVGDAEWMADDTKIGIQPGHFRDDMNVSFPDVSIVTNIYTEAPLPGGYVTNVSVSVSNTVTTTVSLPTDPGTIYTNSTAQTTTNYPISGTYIGSVITNTANVTTTGAPAPGSYIGIIATNTVSVTSSNAPSEGYLGSVVTNYSWFSIAYPGYPSGYYGAVVTNTISTTSLNPPSPGTYVGTVTKNYNGNSDNIKDYTYNRITGYNFRKATSYTYEGISAYSYTKITGYTVAHITGYNLVQSFYVTNPPVVVYYDYIFETGNYICSTINGNVLIKGDANVYITGDVDMTSTGESLQISSEGKLRLYMGGSSFKVAGNANINETGKAENFWYFGLPSNTEVKFAGNAAFTGVIYAPQAHLTLGGGGSDTFDFVGATLTKSVHMAGHFNFHYDEALARTGPSRGYIISSWDEISITENP